jgi:hypothetical protein
VVEAHHQASAGATREAAPRTVRKATRKATGRGVDAATEAARKAIEQGHPVPSARALARTCHVSRDKASQIRTAVLAEADGHGGQPGQLATKEVR